MMPVDGEVMGIVTSVTFGRNADIGMVVLTLWIDTLSGSAAASFVETEALAFIKSVGVEDIQQLCKKPCVIRWVNFKLEFIRMFHTS